ncbi:MAG TPA: hypothetical protein VD906_11645 [Caulobacteraceae bacterium]|nr:hypothetical protein [Caulobacteraceae bacterium]
MNGDRRKFRRTGRALLLCAAAMSLCACMGLPEVEPYGEEPVDANSAAAASIAEQAARESEWPTFAGIPQLPADVRPPQAWSAAVAGTEADRAGLLAAVAPSTWSLSGTEAFAERIRSSLDLRPGDVPSASQRAETEAWARQMRARATPPPRSR